MLDEHSNFTLRYRITYDEGSVLMKGVRCLFCFISFLHSDRFDPTRVFSTRGSSILDGYADNVSSLGIPGVHNGLEVDSSLVL